MRSLPEGAVVYGGTAEFDENTIPDGLRKSHRTKPGTWGRIVVTAGKLLYRIYGPPAEEHILVPGSDGIIEPATEHHVEPVGSVRFRVEFLRVR